MTALQQAIDEGTQSLRKACEDKRGAEQKCKELKDAIENFESNRAKKMKEIEDSIKAMKKEAQASMKEAKKSAQKIQQIKMEIEEAKEEAQSAQEQFEQSADEITKLEQDVEAHAQRAAACKETYEAKEAELDARRERISEGDKQLKQLRKRLSKATKLVEKAELEIKKIGLRAARMEKESESARATVERLLAESPWIAAERQFFGQKNSDYDFERTCPDGALQKLEALTAEQDMLSKKINKKARAASPSSVAHFLPRFSVSLQ